MTTMAHRKIKVRVYGAGGPKLVLIPGAPPAALVADLARTHTVYLLDRRGGGLAAEIDDLATVLEESGAGNVAGTGTGAVVALHGALELPAVERLALHEPPLRHAGHDPGKRRPWEFRRLPTAERAIIEDATGPFTRYRAVTAETLLLGGARAPAYGKRVLNGLEIALPRAHRVTLRGSGTPRAVAAELRKFFR